MIISFIIPTYNRSTILIQCLAALEREQDSHLPFEVIVVDDGSTDDTATRVRQLQDTLSTPLQFLTQANSGPATARNRGIAAARANILVFLGDDIIVQPGYVEHLYNAFQSHAPEQVCILGFTHYHNTSIPTPFGRWLDTRSDLQFDYQTAKVGEALPFWLFYTSNVLVPRQALLDVGGFDERFRFAAWEDTDLGYRLNRKGVPTYYCPSARAHHVHPVNVGAIVRRMHTTARASMELRHINRELFDLLYPQAEKRFGAVGISRRLYRWSFAGPMLRVIKLCDEHLGTALPSIFYDRVINAVYRRELSRQWRKAIKER